MTQILVALIEHGSPLLAPVLSAVGIWIAARASSHAKHARRNSAAAEQNSAAASINSNTAAKHSGEALHQVKNDHTTNLRNDIDTLGEKLDQLIQENDQVHVRMWNRMLGEPRTAEIQIIATTKDDS